MKVYLPHHEAAPQPWTLHWARHYCPFVFELVKVEPGGRFYAEAIARLWDLGEPFVVVEHDVVPWPGAVEQLAACSEPWCAFSHAGPDSDANPGHVFAENGSVEMSCFKVVPKLLGHKSDIRQDGDDRRGEHPAPFPIQCPDWWGTDSVFAQILFGRGHMVHQHWPCVANLNGDYPVDPKPLRERATPSTPTQ